MQPSDSFYNLIVILEDLRLDAYKDSAGIPTIGIGTIQYPDGKKVKMGDKCTEEQAHNYLKHHIQEVVPTINTLLKGVAVNQNQFDAITSLTYNI
jgi:lysozyme